MTKIIKIITILLLLPIRFYLMWYLLKAVNATELPMFIFWVSIPFGVLLSILPTLVTESNKN